MTHRFAAGFTAEFVGGPIDGQRRQVWSETWRVQIMRGEQRGEAFYEADVRDLKALKGERERGEPEHSVRFWFRHTYFPDSQTLYA